MMRSNPVSLMVYVVVMCAASLVQVTASSNAGGSLLTSERVAAFHEWIEVHGKDYETADERNQRLLTWAENDGMFFFRF
jgi:hypothetical protein